MATKKPAKKPSAAARAKSTSRKKKQSAFQKFWADSTKRTFAVIVAFAVLFGSIGVWQLTQSNAATTNLTKLQCNLLGRKFNSTTGVCRDVCINGATPINAPVYNYCPGAVSTSMSASYCDSKNRRYTVGGNGCARRWQQTNYKGAIQCKYKDATYVVTSTVDYCKGGTTSGSSGGSTTSSSSLAWPLGATHFRNNRADYFNGHTAGSGTWTSGVDSLASDLNYSVYRGTNTYAILGGSVSRSSLGGHGLAIRTSVSGGSVEIAYAHGSRTGSASSYSKGAHIMEANSYGNASGVHVHIDIAFTSSTGWKRGICPSSIFRKMELGQSIDWKQLALDTPQTRCSM